jgi:mono/diheme cytochrome c family protein
MYASNWLKSSAPLHGLLTALAMGAALLPFHPARAQPTGDPAEVAEEKEAISFFRDIRPIFQEHCQGCHQPAKPGGEYVMTLHESLLEGGESGEAAIVPGDPEASYLLAQITPEDGVAAMPQGKPPLTESQRERITQWISAGAEDDSPASTRPQYDMDHPPRYPASPVITSLDFSPDGTILAISGYHEVILWSSDGQEIRQRLVGMSERIESAVFSPDGQRLAVTGGSPGRLGEVQVWDVERPELLHSVTVGYDTCYGASWSPDGTRVAFGCPDHSSRVIDATTGEQLFFSGAHDDWVLDTTFSVKGDHLITVSRDMSMKLAHIETQRFMDNITSITPGALKGGINSVDRHPTAEQVVVGGADGVPKTYKIFREQDRRIGDDFNLIRAFDAMPGRISAVAYNRDASHIVAGSSDSTSGQVRVYNEADGKLIASVVLPSAVYSVAFHPEGEVVAAGGFDGLVRLIQVNDGTILHEFPPVPIDEELASITAE